MPAAALAVVGAGISYAGSRKQADEARRARKSAEGRTDQASLVGQQQLEALFGTPSRQVTTYNPIRSGDFSDVLGGGFRYRGGIGQPTTRTIPGTQGSVGRLFDEAGNEIRSGTEAAMSTLRPYAEQGTAAFDLYNKALMGGEGATEAFETFQQSTGYNQLLNEALQSTSRQMGSLGFGQSGNVLTALQDRATGLAQQSYTDWLGALMGSAKVGEQQATNLANMQQGLGLNLANLLTGQAGLELDFRKALMGGEYGVSTTAAAGIPELAKFGAEATAAKYDALGSLVGGLGGLA